MEYLSFQQTFFEKKQISIEKVVKKQPFAKNQIKNNLYDARTYLSSPESALRKDMTTKGLETQAERDWVNYWVKYNISWSSKAL